MPSRNIFRNFFKIKVSIWNGIVYFWERAEGGGPGVLVACKGAILPFLSGRAGLLLDLGYLSASKSRGHLISVIYTPLNCYISPK